MFLKIDCQFSSFFFFINIIFLYAIFQFCLQFLTIICKKTQIKISGV